MTTATREHTWTRITTTDSVPPREGRSVQVGGMELAIFNLSDRLITLIGKKSIR